jgi:hypothetical protein
VVKPALKYGRETWVWVAEDNTRTDAASVRTSAGEVYTV